MPNNTGYLDALMGLFLVMSFRMAVSGPLYGLLAIGIIGPLTHESFIFLWPPVALLLLMRQERPGVLVAGALAPVLTTVAIVFFNDPAATALQIAALPDSEEVKRTLLDNQLGQSMRQAFHGMVMLHERFWPAQMWALLYFCAPAFLMLGIFVWARAKELSPWYWLVLAFCFSPLVALAFAWDLSRFLVPVNLAVFCGILALETRIGASVRRSWLPLALVPWVIFSAMSPLVYSYFDRSDLHVRGFLPIEGTWSYRAVSMFAYHAMSPER
ncbi:MAG: hypothetical protein KBG72_00005 [Agrobacterium sp.]|nr:hypothetical protein [Agrobacterium sp.]